MSSTSLNAQTWSVSEVKFMKPRVNDGGKGKSVTMISTQLSTSLRLSTPVMSTWGISDFVDPKTGLSDGKYTISLQFPSDDQPDSDTAVFLAKFKELEENVLDAAVQYSELWWGEKRSRDMVKMIYNPSLKYPKIQGTQRPDHTRSPTLRAKVYLAQQTGKWDLEIYDAQKNLIFPEEGNDGAHPKDYVPSQSKVACLIQCGSLWFTGAGWGITWKVLQAVVIPPEKFKYVGGTKRCLVDGEFVPAGAAAAAAPPAAAATQPSRARNNNNDVMAGVLVDDSDDEDVPPPPPLSAPAPSTPSDPVAAAATSSTSVEETTAATADIAAAIDSTPKSNDLSSSLEPAPKKKKMVVQRQKSTSSAGGDASAK